MIGSFQELVNAQPVNERASCKVVEWCCAMAFSEGVRDPAQLWHLPCRLERRLLRPLGLPPSRPLELGSRQAQATSTPRSGKTRQVSSALQFTGCCLCHGSCSQPDRLSPDVTKCGRMLCFALVSLANTRRCDCSACVCCFLHKSPASCCIQHSTYCSMASQGA